LVSPSRQCSITPVGLGQGFLSKNNVTTLDHLSSSPDLAAADFYLFPRMKSALKGRRWRFCDITDVIKNAIEELRRISQYGFQECFQQLTVAGRIV
jgi:hypothetical protein